MEVELPSLAFIVAIFLCFLGFILRKRWSGHRKSREVISLPPGPRKWPIIGNLHLLTGGYIQRTLRSLARIYGPLMHLRLGQVDFVIASSREAAEDILKHQDLNFAFRPDLAFGRILGYGNIDVSLAPYGSYWKQMRKIYAMELMSITRVKSFSSIREAAVLSMVEQIHVAANGQTPVALSEMLMFTVNLIAMRSAFGEKPTQKQQNFLFLVRETMTLLNSISIEDLFPSLTFVDVLLGATFKLQRLHRQLDSLFDDLIAQHQADRGDHSENTREHLLDVLVRLKEQGDFEFPVTLEVIKTFILDVFIAGSDASTGIIEWAMAEMMRNPKIREKAQQEVRQALKGKSRIEESDIAELHYLKQVIKETLRFHTPSPLLVPRECQETCQVLGYRVPAKTRVFINVWALARDERYWGPDAESFDPERFANSSVDYRGFNYEYLPFGSGRRVCPGMTFGLASVEILLANLLCYFDWQLPDGMKPEELDMVENPNMSSSKKSPLFLLATPRIPLPSIEGV